MMISLFLEQSVQRSVWFAFCELCRMLASLSVLFYPFSMQTRGHNFGFAVNYGRAGYVATGRGYAIKSNSVVQLFTSYAASHIYFGIEMAAMLILYELWKAKGKDFMSTWSVWSVVISLCLSPWIFNPQALHRATLWTSWVEWTLWLYGRGDLTVGNGSWKNWAEKRLAAKRNASVGLKLQIACRNLSTKLLVCVACAQGLELPRHHSTFLWHGIFLGRAIGVVVSCSVYLALALRLFEAFMQRVLPTYYKILPVLTLALLVAAYLAMAMVLLLFEHGSWLGLLELYSQHNVWLLMVAAISVQAGVVQLLGAVGDKQKFITKLSMSFVGELEDDEGHLLINERLLKLSLARHLPGVSVADISLKAVVSGLKEGDAAASASAFASAFQSKDEKLRDKLFKKRGWKKEAAVTDVTATIVTSHVANSRKTKVLLEADSIQKLRAITKDAVGDHLIQSKRVEQTCEVSQEGFRRRLLAYAQFWQRIGDQSMTLCIFAVLTVLTIMPILQVQTSILFNRAFSAILMRKIHKQELLDDLYTPALFVPVKADESDEPLVGIVGAAGRAVTKARRGSVAAIKNMSGRIAAPAAARGGGGATPGSAQGGRGVIGKGKSKKLVSV